MEAMGVAVAMVDCGGYAGGVGGSEQNVRGTSRVERRDSLLKKR